MTLRDLLVAYPRSFYPQTWYLAEPFLDTPAEMIRQTPIGFYRRSALLVAGEVARLPLAVELAEYYLREPGDRIWRQYLWCRDTDREGHRVYLGVNGAGLEIHRHLHLTGRWGVACW